MENISEPYTKGHGYTMVDSRLVIHDAMFTKRVTFDNRSSDVFYNFTNFLSNKNIIFIIPTS